MGEYPVTVFITLEGPEGAGKSSVAKALAVHKALQGREVKLTREPGSGELGAKIRQILLDGDQIDPKSEIFLFLADRAQHVSNIIRPSLQQGKVVICDRYTDSTIVYQGYARGHDIELLRAWNAFATGNLVPSLTLLLDLDPRVGLSRILDKNRLDSEPIEFHENVRAGFLKEASLEPNRWSIIDANQPLDKVIELAAEATGGYLY